LRKILIRNKKMSYINYANDLEAQNAKSILETITELLGHKTIRNIFMHTVDFYENGDYVLETTTLRTGAIMEDIFKLYEFIYPTYDRERVSRPSVPRSTPSRKSITTNLFHYLYGNAYFRFTVVSGKEYNLNLGYSPMPFLTPNGILSLQDVDSVLIGLFNSQYDQKYIPNSQSDFRSQAFFDNSIELFKAIEPKLRDSLEFIKYDKSSVQDILFKVITSLQRTVGSKVRGNRLPVRIQIDNLLRSRDSGRWIHFYNIPVGSNHFSIYLTKADLAGLDIFTFTESFILERDIDFDKINMVAVNNKIAALWSILSYYKGTVKFSYIENTGSEGWQYIGLEPFAQGYDFIPRNERLGFSSPSHIEIDADLLLNGNVDEMDKLLEIIRVSMGYKPDGTGKNTQFGFVLSDGINNIAVFDGQGFYSANEIRSEVYAQRGEYRYFHRVIIGDLIADSELIDYCNILWDYPFYYKNLNRIY
jgi:hypothetical protein